MSDAERAQTLQDEAKLLEARARLVSCANASCPAVIRNDCVHWLTKIDTQIPSIVLRARDASGRDVVAVRVSVDGQERGARLDGRPIPLNPGEHVIHLEAAGFVPSDERVLVAAGEQSRPVVVALSAAGAAGTPSASSPVPPRREEPPPRGAPSSGPPAGRIVGFALVGVGVLALGSFGLFEGLGQSSYGDLKNGCGATRSCPPGDVDSVRTKFTVAGISLAVAGISLATGAVLLWTHRDGRTTASVGLSPNSAWARLRF